MINSALDSAVEVLSIHVMKDLIHLTDNNGEILQDYYYLNCNHLLVGQSTGDIWNQEGG